MAPGSRHFSAEAKALGGVLAEEAPLKTQRRGCQMVTLQSLVFRFKDDWDQLHGDRAWSMQIFSPLIR